MEFKIDCDFIVVFPLPLCIQNCTYILYCDSEYQYVISCSRVFTSGCISIALQPYCKYSIHPAHKIGMGWQNRYWSWPCSIVLCFFYLTHSSTVLPIPAIITFGCLRVHSLVKGLKIEINLGIIKQAEHWEQFNTNYWWELIV